MPAIVENPTKEELKNSKTPEVIGGEFEIEVGDGIDAQGITVEVKEEPTIEATVAGEQTVEDPAVEEPVAAEQTVEVQTVEVPGYIAGHVITFEGDKVISHDSVVNNCMNVPENIKQEFSRDYENVFTIDEITARANSMSFNLAPYLDVKQDKDGNSIMKFKSPDILKNVLSQLKFPFNEKINIVVLDQNNNNNVSYMTKDDEREKDGNEMDVEGQNEQSTDRDDGRNDRQGDSRVRVLGSMDSGDIHAVVNAGDKDTYDEVCNSIEDSNKTKDIALGKVPKITRDYEAEKDGMDIGSR